MTERDANQLAADVRAAVEAPKHFKRDAEQTAVALAALDELVGLVGTLHAQGYDEGQNDVWNSPVCSVCGQNHDRDESAMCDDGEVVSLGEFVQSVGALVAALTRLADDRLALMKSEEQGWQTECDELKARAEAAEAALATTRQALTACVRAIEDAYGGDPVPEDSAEGEALDTARRALAATDEPA